MLKHDKTIAFIGAGNMATALIKGLLAQAYPCQLIWAADPNNEQLQSLKNDTGINISGDNELVIGHADILVLAVKPQMIQEVLLPLQSALAKKPLLLISIAAGISIQSLEALSSARQPVIRCMPNTPALVQAGASALFANTQASEEQKQSAESILAAVGTVCWLQQESDMDVVTALSGSGPAYFFLFTEALRQAAITLGLDADIANQLALQTAFGSAKLALNSEDDIAELRRKVTSPGGTTAAALAQLEKDDFNSIIARALKQAKTRSEELALSSASTLLTDNKE
mgnify:CR=1 FL=1|tara:strand:- start:36192 stop:37046 length:855 start_codon:yes stop_codon:yes gene_type:complete